MVMTGLLFVCSTLCALLLVIGAAIAPRSSSLSRFELNRRKKGGDEAAKLDAQRDLLYQDVVSLLRAKLAVILVVFVLTTVAALGWLVGTLVAVVVALEYGAVARLPWVRKMSQKIYDKYELKILNLVSRYRHITRWIRMAVPSATEPHIDSMSLLRLTEFSQTTKKDMLLMF